MPDEHADDVTSRPSYEELEAEVRRLRQQVATLEAALKRALEELEAARRAGKRQAAPFRREERKPDPKRPGRKPGHQAAQRPIPRKADRVLEAKLPHTNCLACGGELRDHTIQVQYQVDIPPVQPVVTQFNIEVATCAQCGQRAQARHPEQTSDALGAAAVQIGPDALALASEMKHRLGVPYRKVTEVLGNAFGLTVCPAALARADQRLAKKAEPTYELMLTTLRQRPVVCGDETGWYVNGKNAWLWVFTSDAVTLYRIDRRRSHEVAESILGKEFAGVLSCDCFLAYDPLPYKQHKCAAHLLRRCSEMQEKESPTRGPLSEQVAGLLRIAIMLRKRKPRLSAEEFEQERQVLEASLDRLLEGEQPDADDARLAKLLRKHRARILTFLYVEGLEPTNNAAERALRPAVVARKTSGGSRSEAGAKAHAILSSVMETCRKQGRNFRHVVAALLRSRLPVGMDLCACPDAADATRRPGEAAIQPNAP